MALCKNNTTIYLSWSVLINKRRDIFIKQFENQVCSPRKNCISADYDSFKVSFKLLLLNFCSVLTGQCRSSTSMPSICNSFRVKVMCSDPG